MSASDSKMSKWAGSIQVDARMIENSGIGVVIRNITSRMIRNNPNYFFHVLIQNDSQQDHQWLKLHNVACSVWKPKIYSIKEHLFSIPGNHHPDITWVPHYNVSAQIRGKVVATIHDLFHIENTIVQRSPLHRFYARSMFNWVKYRCDGIHFISKTTQQVFHSKIGKPKSERIILNGVDPVWFTPSPSETNRIHPRPYVVFVGNGFPHKNLVRLISAIRLLQSSNPIDLLVVGNFEGLRITDQEAINAAKNNSEFIHMAGKVSFEKLLSIISGADALVSPSLYEGFGLPPLEALAMGVPVVVSRIPVHQEIFSGIAHFVDPYSVESISKGIQSAIQDNLLRSERQEFAKHFNWDTASANLFEYLTSFSKNAHPSQKHEN